MRLTRFLLVFGCSALLGACGDDEVTYNTPPQLAYVRYINAMSDTGAVDVRMIDQLEYSAFALGLLFRSGTEYQGTEAKPRHIRVFPTSQDIAVTSQVLVDTTITFEVNKYYTLLLVGPARSGSQRFLVIEDQPPTVDPTQVAIRAFHAGAEAGNVDGYTTDTTSAPLPATPALANVAPFTSSAYVTLPTGKLAVSITSAGTTTLVARGDAPRGAPGTSTMNPQGGVLAGGSALSVFAFPASVPGSKAPQTAAFQTPGVVFFLDLLPPKTAS